MSTADDPKNPLEVIESLAGLPKGESKRIFAEVKENHRRLDACPGPHNFVEHERYSPTSTLVRTYRCTVCMGVVGTSEARWYIKGLEAKRP